MPETAVIGKLVDEPSSKGGVSAIEEDIKRATTELNATKANLKETIEKLENELTTKEKLHTKTEGAIKGTMGRIESLRKTKFTELLNERQKQVDKLKLTAEELPLATGELLALTIK